MNFYFAKIKIMTDNQKFYAVLIVIAATPWLVWLFPDNRISRFLLTWQGPFPRNGETYARFKFRWSVYAFKWFVILAGFQVCGLWINGGLDKGEPLFITAMLGFIFPLGAIVAFVGGAGLAIHALYLRYAGKPRIFDEEEGGFITQGE